MGSIPINLQFSFVLAHFFFTKFLCISLRNIFVWISSYKISHPLFGIRDEELDILMGLGPKRLVIITKVLVKVMLVMFTLVDRIGMHINVILNWIVLIFFYALTMVVVCRPVVFISILVYVDPWALDEAIGSKWACCMFLQHVKRESRSTDDSLLTNTNYSQICKICQGWISIGCW